VFFFQKIIEEEEEEEVEEASAKTDQHLVHESMSLCS
jgi:hypothetical protein